MLRQQAEENEAKEQTLILVSSVMTWINTPKKIKKNLPKPDIDDSEADDEPTKLRADESETEDDPNNPANKVLYFTDKDFSNRVPAPRYQQVKTLEMVAMSA